MSEEIKVSVIIPAYNVENYIEKCVNSVLGQSYGNIEIIVVNDGSTDGTHEILKRISDCDKRLVVIETANFGVSSARNTGLSIATGKYIVFVDGDDYLANDYIEYMMLLVSETKAEFCLCKNCYTEKKEKQIENVSTQIISSDEAIALLLSPTVIVGCWNKIYSKEFLVKNNLRFSTNLFYGEGLSFIITAAQKANFVGVSNKKIYYYRRNNEFSATTKFSIEKLINGEKALKKIRKSIDIKSKRINTMYYLHMGLYSLGAVVKIKANNKENEYLCEYNHWKKALRFYTLKIVCKKDVSIYRKLMLIGGCVSPWLLMKMDIMRRKKISTKSVEN